MGKKKKSKKRRREPLDCWKYTKKMRCNDCYEVRPVTRGEIKTARGARCNSCGGRMDYINVN